MNPAIETASPAQNGIDPWSASEFHPDPALNPTPAAEASTTRSPGEFYTVLLAEDSPLDTFLVREAIANYHLPISLQVLEDGEKACTYIQKAERNEAPCPAMALLDLNLPKRDGIEVLKRIRQSSVCGNIPVVIVTSSDSPRDRAAAEQLGANRYFQKPTDYDEYLTLGKVLEDLIGELENTRL
jgi:chemotaxis family two-component system response regulator Rcp1